MDGKQTQKKTRDIIAVMAESIDRENAEKAKVAAEKDNDLLTAVQKLSDKEKARLREILGIAAPKKKQGANPDNDTDNDTDGEDNDTDGEDNDTDGEDNDGDKE